LVATTAAVTIAFWNVVMAMAFVAATTAAVVVVVPETALAETIAARAAGAA